jgi:hypothetical protein
VIHNVRGERKKILTIIYKHSLPISWFTASFILLLHKMVSRPPSRGIFTYDSIRDWEVTRTAWGIKRSWADLCTEFDRQGPPCPAKDAVHFKRTSIVGPELFAISCDALKVFYHDEGEWHQYQSAREIRLGTRDELMEFFLNDDDDDNEDWSQEDNDGKDRDDDEPSRESKETHSNNDSKYPINRTILANRLLQMVLLVQLQFRLIQYQSWIR